jgi:L-lactate permease
MVGASIAVFTLVTMVPVVVMFAVFAARSTGPRRIRSLLLASGMVVLIASGSMHNIARSGEVYVFADLLTIIGVVVLGAGVLYQMEQSMAPASGKPILAPPSNTV